MASFYEILDIPANASEAEIRRAYRLKAKQYHPDINKSPEAQNHFIQVKKAYETLVNKNTRAAYNQRTRKSPQNNFDPLSSFEAYEAWKQAQRAKEQHEEWQRQQEFLKNREKFRNSWLYLPTKIFIYLATGFCYLFGAFVVVLCFYVAYKIHLLVIILLIPFITGGIYFIKLTGDWFRSTKRYF